MTDNNNRIQLLKLGLHSPKKASAIIDLKPGLNIIHGASDTGKSFFDRTVDFMLGGSAKLKDIPERNSYDKISLDLVTTSNDKIHIERSSDGGDFSFIKNDGKKEILNAKHDSKSYNSLSRQLLLLLDLDKTQILTAKGEGKKRPISFRDLVHLLIVHEEEITKSRSPILSGQFTSATQEKSVFKFCLTGTDDEAYIGTKKTKKSDVSLELINQLITEYKSDLQHDEKPTDDIDDQLNKLNTSIEKQNKAVDLAQEDLQISIKSRNELEKKRDVELCRIDEIAGLLERFDLLEKHYANDLKRLESIKESGVLLTFLDYNNCPLCGALPDNQKHDSSCDGDIKSVIDAASAEIIKILQLKKDLGKTVRELTDEKDMLLSKVREYDKKLKDIQDNISKILAPELTDNKSKFSDLVKKHYQVTKTKDILEKISALEEKKKQLSGQDNSSSKAKEDPALSKSVLGDFSKKIENILKSWKFPGVDRVYFDEGEMDIVISDKPRNSYGKGLRAITHAAFSIALLEFCVENNLPHPGFVLLDSPLLAYKEPEPGDNNIEKTDLKDKFYHYLDNLNNDHIQIIIAENIAPPTNLKNSNIIYFSGIDNSGRYGLFPSSRQPE